MNNKNIMIVIGAIALIGVVVFLMTMNSNSPADVNEQPDVTVDENVVEDMDRIDSADNTEMAESNTIVDVAVANGSFQTLVTAVTEAGLVETLSGDGPFTVFAPTDEAFAKLPEGTLESLLANPDQLVQVLTYHVVPGKVMASDVVNLDSATTVEGSTVSITVMEDGTVKVNDATVVTTDVEASNGVIHVIDTVLLPPQE